MSLIDDLRSEIEYAEDNRESWTDQYKAKRLVFNNILSGNYGTEIMLDYLDYLGGDSVAFVAEYAKRGVNLESKEC